MKEKPNILLIHADQHRYDCLGAYGNTDIKTPNIDQLARDSVVFENSFCPHPVCTPSRYSLLCGQYIHQHLGLTNSSTLAHGIPTLPRALTSDGYRTAAVGKMHFTPTYLDVGFDEMHLAEQCGKGRYDDNYHRWLRDEGLCDRLDMIDQVSEFRERANEEYWENFGAFQSDLDEAHHSTTWIGDRALEQIESWGSGPNFLMAGFIKPHHPFDPPAPWSTMYNPEDLTLLPGWTEALIHGDSGKSFFDYSTLTEKSLRRVMALYYASISQIDFHVGRMIDRLKRKGLYDNTVIVYTSDHGDYMGYHHRILKGYRMFEPLVRVPLLIKYAAGTVAPGRDERLVNNVDVAPTLLHAAQITPPETMSGMNLTQENDGPDYVFAEKADEYMVRSRTSKLLLNRNPEKSMFFDLERDPLEMENRIADDEYQSEIASLRDRLVNWCLFDSRANNHLNHDAPLCRAENVRDGDTGLYEHFKPIMLRNENQPLEPDTESAPDSFPKETRHGSINGHEHAAL